MPWLRALLRLLLCLSLTVNAVGSAWASVAMAAPVAAAKAASTPATAPAAMAAHAGCHEAMAAAHASDRDQQAPAPDHDGAFKHCCGNGCDCLQHAGAPLLAAAPGVAVAHAALNTHCEHGRGCPAPYRPIRPPIG